MMTPPQFLGKTVTVVGAARSGQAAARLIVRLNGRVKISESAGEGVVDPEFRRWALDRGVEFEFNGHTRDFISKSDLLVLSPGVRIDAEPVRWAREAGVRVWSEVELGYRVCRRPIIAVTGSNGKTTVSTLIKMVIDASGRKACLCGNVGAPFTEYADDGQYDYFVVEISSFQLETIERFHPYIAVFLNFSQNHLDRHKDIQEYFDAKKRVCLNQDSHDFAVLNAADEWVKGLSKEIKSRVIFFNAEAGFNEGSRNPNHLAVIQAAKILGIPQETCLNVFESFRGVEHRLETVRTLEGVEYINDSKATTAEAGRWALQNTHRPVVMICGGRDKHIDFSVLSPLVKEKVRAMIVFGEAQGTLRETFQRVVPVAACESLDQAVTRARASARQGDAVLLSPMCASFDMFKNFEERGRVFKEIVNGLT